MESLLQRTRRPNLRPPLQLKLNLQSKESRQNVICAAVIIDFTYANNSFNFRFPNDCLRSRIGKSARIVLVLTRLIRAPHHFAVAPASKAITRCCTSSHLSHRKHLHTHFKLRQAAFSPTRCRFFSRHHLATRQAVAVM